MRSLRFVLPSVALTSLALAAPPSPEHKALAAQLKTAGDALKTRVKRLADANVSFTSTIKNAQRERPTPEEMKALTAQMTSLEAEGKQLEDDCVELRERVQPLRDGFAGADAYCRNGSPSMTQTDCKAWSAFEPLFVPLGDCPRETQELGRVSYRFREFETDWRKQQDALEEEAEKAAAFRRPVSGSPRQRAIPLPPAYVTYNQNVHPRFARTIDTVRLFADAHPSHFVFLRKDAAAPENSGEGDQAFSRKLKKGEAVLPLQDRSAGDDEVSIISIDGNEGLVKVSALALAPIAGTKPVALVAGDLNVRDDKGTLIAGPSWLAPDSTGFFLDEAAGWLDLLDPPEPRSQRFYDAKEKVLACYKKQMERLDPSGNLRENYDVVTYGRAGVNRVESAESNFDRKACAACNCKAFNALKAKLVKEAMTPAQKKLFERYAPVLEQLRTTDFINAAKGAPRGKEADAPQPL